MRALPLVAAQVPPRSTETAIEDLRDEIVSLLAEQPQVRLVCYPEYHTCLVRGDPDERRRGYAAIAEPLDGPRVQHLADVARGTGVWLLPGTVIERGPGDAIYNTAVAISPDGEVVASYRKMFPWRPFEPFTVGDAFTVFDVPAVGRIGLAICYDLWFPEVARQLAWLGAEVVVYPTHTSSIDREKELVLAQATAIQNQVYVVSVNAAAPEGTGRSLVVDPEGLVRAQAPSEQTSYVSDVLDLDAVTRVRRYGTCGLNRIWSQFRSDDPVIALPAYGGAFRPQQWEPAHHPGKED